MGYVALSALPQAKVRAHPQLAQAKVAGHFFHECTGRHGCHLPIKGQEHDQVYPQHFQQRQLLAGRREVARSAVWRQDYDGVGMERNESSQPVRGPGPLHHGTNERLMAAMQTVKRANGQDRFLPQVSLGQIVEYLHGPPPRVCRYEAKTFLGRHSAEAAS